MHPPELVEIDPQHAITVRGDVPPDDLAAFFGPALSTAAAAAATAGVELAGPPFGYYAEMSAETVVVEAGFPVAEAVADLGDAHPLVLPGGRAVQTVHEGSYDTLQQTYAALEAWMAERGLHPASGPWEVYLTDPGTEPDPGRWQTRVVWPVG
ncbi:Bacterial transcription activator, effector binding domain [Nocardioides dokdonensis FR1436]|uniref:Bacterial transcription activator, effector binding domain n=2 Tax=Nocardioides TaxID=1839 RepID=A0A1A9GF09_9ACTN|nr:Bacterial transcription activator, effector binding domain [Nocardioides dokdonensis FR1436]